MDCKKSFILILFVFLLTACNSGPSFETPEIESVSYPTDFPNDSDTSFETLEIGSVSYPTDFPNEGIESLKNAVSGSAIELAKVDNFETFFANNSEENECRVFIFDSLSFSFPDDTVVRQLDPADQSNSPPYDQDFAEQLSRMYSIPTHGDCKERCSSCDCNGGVLALCPNEPARAYTHPDPTPDPIITPTPTHQPN